MFYHLLRSRPDPAAATLAPGLPATNHVVMILLMRPFVWASRLSGQLPSLFEYPARRPTSFFELVPARCEFLDQALLSHASDGGQVAILWEGVTYYLEEHSIESTLRTVASFPAGSCIAFDFFSREWLESAAGKRAGRSVRMIYREPWIFGIPVMPDFTGRLRDYLEKRGLAIRDHRPLGEEEGGDVPYGGLVLTAKPA